jgi:hypothetical protein
MPNAIPVQSGFSVYRFSLYNLSIAQTLPQNPPNANIFMEYERKHKKE